MTDKQKRFAEEYLIDCNATKAYRRAYPRVKNDAVARANAARLLANANVQKYIEEHQKKIQTEKIASAQEVQEFLTGVMRQEILFRDTAVVDVGHGKSEVRIVEKPPSAKDAIRAAELLGKSHSLFMDKVDANVDMDLNISIDYGDNT